MLKNRAAQLQTLFRAFQMYKDCTLTVKTSADLRDNLTTAITLLVVTHVFRAKQELKIQKAEVYSFFKISS